ncbi:MAG TPA: tetratricopeptide repeat protein [Candidatus Marinimicrobia bacterium]|nr:tetratricopeptide repeat protein [Candidatus Neomarinimicrobiota bacterium]
MKRWIHFIEEALIVCLIIGLMNCTPPSPESSELVMEQVETKPTIDRDKCDLYLSFAYSYYQNQNWRSAIENYKKMSSFGCEEEYAKDLFPFWGRAYQQLASENSVYLDSALYVYLAGEKYLPNDLFLKKNIAYIYHLQGKIDLEIREYEKMIEIAPDDIELYRTLVKLYISAQRYEDVIYATNGILKINPNDEQALNDRIFAYQKLGRDITTIQKEQWEKNPTNIRYGLEYAAALKQQREYDKALEVYQKVAELDAKNIEAWSNIADIYFTQKNNYAEALKAYDQILRNISPNDLNILQQAARCCQLLGDFPKGMEYAQKAITIAPNSPQAYKIRADLYYAAADYYTSGRQITFEDKLVYKLAYDDYLKVMELGDASVKSRIDHLKEYLIPTPEEWFFNRYDANGAMRTSFRPLSPEYKWITVEPKKN